jgi:uncharacterized membrane protein YqaE (UPF0057 family)
MTTTAPRAEASTAAITALICAVIIPPLGIMIGHTARGQDKRAGQEPSALATLATVLGYVLTAAWIIGVIVLSASSSRSGTPACNPSNPAWPYCTTVGP